MSSPLRIAILWHMHQPYYRNPRTGVFRLPWVRLHTVKDYHHMAVRIADFPRLKANVNLVPCLVEQILDYARGDVSELHLDLSRKAARDLRPEEKVSMLQHFFLGNRRTMIEPYTRYRSLLQKCTDLTHEYKVHSAIRQLKDQDLRDLQVWSNLAWMGKDLEADPLISDLHARARNFTESMKSSLLERQTQLIGEVLGRYKHLEQSGQVEISTSPYFHPILPLLCNSEVARVALPDIKLPARRLSYPGDARAQIEAGIGLHRKVFGKQPAGMWPPEAALSEETAALAAAAGFRWMAAAESTLEASLGTSLRDPQTGALERPDLLYRPHSFVSGGREVLIFFRDSALSDLISFRYKDLPSREAVGDFMSRLDGIRRDLGDEVRRSVILVALDGENCWEFYDKGGDPFLKQLYGELSSCDRVETVLLSEALEPAAGGPALKSIHPGSWIGNDLSTWIGSPQHNAAWDLLGAAREEVSEKGGGISDEKRRAAWRSIYAAEGSDWYWWYGKEQVSGEDPEFDALFRSHLRHAYEAVGSHVPARALEPITSVRKKVAIPFEPAAVMKPMLDGKVTTFYEWKLAGLYESYRDSTRTTGAERLLNAIYFGFDHDNLYLRLDTAISPRDKAFTHLLFRLEFEVPVRRVIAISATEPCVEGSAELRVRPEAEAGHVRAVACDITEVAVPFGRIPAGPGDRLAFRVAVIRRGKRIERRPIHDVISFEVPRKDFEAEMWSTL
jgi:alpha-amylase/alpha-mannosidase (GH57 family)